MKAPSRVVLSLSILALCSLAAAALPAQEQAAAAQSSFASEDEKMLYTLGLAIAGQIGQFGITEEELELVQSGLADAVLGRDAKVDLQTYGPKLQEFAQQRVSAQAAIEKQAAAGFLASEAARPGAVKTESGLLITELEAGDGASPAATDTVRVHYHGTLRDGTVFDSSVDRDEPAQFPLDRVISCWTEGLQQMKVGGKSRLVCPSEIAYGDQGRPGIPGGATLVFEVELLEIVAAEGS